MHYSISFACFVLFSFTSADGKVIIDPRQAASSSSQIASLASSTSTLPSSLSSSTTTMLPSTTTSTVFTGRNIILPPDGTDGPFIACNASLETISFNLGLFDFSSCESILGVLHNLTGYQYIPNLHDANPENYCVTSETDLMGVHYVNVPAGPGADNEMCSEYLQTEAGDSCDVIGPLWKISNDQFTFLNNGTSCDDPLVGETGKHHGLSLESDWTSVRSPNGRKIASMILPLVQVQKYHSFGINRPKPGNYPDLARPNPGNSTKAWSEKFGLKKLNFGTDFAAQSNVLPYMENTINSRSMSYFPVVKIGENWYA
ncbi:hypothetical protein C8R46DRAFT_1027730 [Mycena filopes]|nr:hypothetical protein C8R46DRAFT_1027730 [Mycena filopes]